MNAFRKHKPAEYRHIRVWGKIMGSYEYYIHDQQDLASEENAPLNAIYKKTGFDTKGQTTKVIDGPWVTFDDIVREDTRDEIMRLIKIDEKLRGVRN